GALARSERKASKAFLSRVRSATAAGGGARAPSKAGSPTLKLHRLMAWVLGRKLTTLG
ncbi:MAG: hypothetical protein QOK48_2514, partial [Blastocatellia bacterium]|nr:hypothetical protein [Blastocatellia bacterium]